MSIIQLLINTATEVSDSTINQNKKQKQLPKKKASHQWYYFYKQNFKASIMAYREGVATAVQKLFELLNNSTSMYVTNRKLKK